jgi:hypothetical protein
MQSEFLHTRHLGSSYLRFKIALKVHMIVEKCNLNFPWMNMNNITRTCTIKMKSSTLKTIRKLTNNRPYLDFLARNKASSTKTYTMRDF